MLVAAALVATTLIGMARAKAMTRLRRQALGAPALADRVRREARIAAGLRGGIGLLTLGLLVLGSALAAS